RWRRKRTAQDGVDTNARKTGLERRLEHVAGNSGVLADQDRGSPRRTTGQYPSGGLAQPHHETGRDGIAPDRASYAVGAEVLSTHCCPLKCSRVASQTFNASRVSATSWTRTIRAPRSTAIKAAAAEATARSPVLRPVACLSIPLREMPISSGRG